MNVIVIDGQGGKLGKTIVEELKKALPNIYITAIGTNSTATEIMLKAGADCGATGENPVIVNVRKADYIIGPMGIVLADSLMGEVTPAMAAAIGSSDAKKILIPYNKCNTIVVSVDDTNVGYGDYVAKVVDILKKENCRTR